MAIPSYDLGLVVSCLEGSRCLIYEYDASGDLRAAVSMDGLEEGVAQLREGNGARRQQARTGDSVKAMIQTGGYEGVGIESRERNSLRKLG
jgi:hypothetical protein